VRQSWGRAGPPRCAPSWARGARARQSKRERRPGAAGASAASSAIRCYPLRGAPIMGSGGSRKYQGGCVRSETMRSGLALAGQESNSGLVRIGMEDRGGVLVGFRHSQKKGERRRGSMENGIRCRQSRRGREGPRGCRCPISGAAVILPNCSFLLHHQIRPGF
jgi:hypothetical protein